jgi:hypothetical protein
VRRPTTPRFRYNRPPSRASDAARADVVQVRQAAQPHERHCQSRRAAGAEGVAPAAGRGAGCHSWQGRGIGERGCLLAAEQAEGWMWPSGVFPPSLAPSPSAFPLRPASSPPSATPPHAARGPYLSSSHWSLVRVASGLARLVRASWRPLGRCNYSCGRGVGEAK